MTQYLITTRDPETDEFTPQKGCPHKVNGVAGLRKALRKLQGMGYETRHGHEELYCDAADVLVERADEPGLFP